MDPRADVVRVTDRAAVELLADEPDPAVLDQIEKDGVALVAQGASIVRRGALAVSGVLTREQRGQLLTAWRAWQRRMLPAL